MVFSLLGALTLGVTAEEPCEHLYGTTGDARFTCVKCGEVDEDLYDAVYCDLSGVFSTVWSEDFESDPIQNGWSFTDLDGDKYNWQWKYNTDGDTSQMNAHSGSGLIASASYDDNDGALEPDEPTAGPCPYCGETHNNKTIAGWWTELLHHLLFIIQRIAFWWM